MCSESKNPIRATVTIRNNRLLSHREGLQLNQKKMAEACGVSFMHYCDLETLRSSPIKHGDWTDTALKICVFLEATPEYLFPEVVHKINKNKSQLFIADKLMSQINESANMLTHPTTHHLLADPEESLVSATRTKTIRKVLSTLAPREQKILELRFGLNGNAEHTIDEIGKQYEVTRERVREIVAKGIRKLRHPERARLLDEKKQEREFEDVLKQRDLARRILEMKNKKSNDLSDEELQVLYPKKFMDIDEVKDLCEGPSRRFIYSRIWHHHDPLENQKAEYAKYLALKWIPLGIQNIRKGHDDNIPDIIFQTDRSEIVKNFYCEASRYIDECKELPEEVLASVNSQRELENEEIMKLARINGYVTEIRNGKVYVVGWRNKK